MSYPAINDDQRDMAIAMLANALRRGRGRHASATEPDQENLLGANAGQRRSEAELRYVRGMVDLLAVLFAGGRATANDCYEAALGQEREGGRAAEPKSESPAPRHSEESRNPSVPLQPPTTDVSE